MTRPSVLARGIGPATAKKYILSSWVRRSSPFVSCLQPAAGALQVGQTMKRNPPAAKPVIHNQQLVFCPDDGKRIATFDEQGLLVICKECRTEQVISYEAIELIRQAFLKPA